MIQCVFAIGEVYQGTHYAFGYKNRLPWGRISQDMKNFKRRTTTDDDRQSVVVMGRKTFESLPRRLENRLNVVLCSDGKQPKTKKGDSADMIITPSDITLEQTLRELEKQHGLVSVIGGVSLIEQCLDYADRFVMTIVFNNTTIPYDVTFSRYTLRELVNRVDITEQNRYDYDNGYLIEYVLDKKVNNETIS